MSVLVICPSRGRPGAAAEALASFTETRRDPASRFVIVIDSDDPLVESYPTQVPHLLGVPSGGSMGATLQRAVTPDLLGGSTVIGMIGDDVRFRTPGWDVAFLERLASPGIAWADDGYQHDRKASHWWVSRAIVDVFGLAPPALRHFYMDDYWKALGETVGVAHYMPELLIEHMHPDAGKGERDETYDRTAQFAEADKRWYRRWYRLGRHHDARRLRAIVRG